MDQEQVNWSRRKNVALGALCSRGHDHGGGSYRRPNRSCIECLELAQRAWTENRSANIAARKKAWRESSLPVRKAVVSLWYANNRESRAKSMRAWQLANPAKRAYYGAARRAAEKMAMPPWADQVAIRRFYEEARRRTSETGVPHEVDHIVPLQHPNVCGLHVSANLQVLTASENSKKWASFDTAKRWAKER